MNVHAYKEPSSNTTSVISQSLKELEQKTLIPPGYAEIRLSTKGKLGAPEVFHARNFKTQDVLALSLTEDKYLPARVLDILQSMIFEKDCDVNAFHEKEVEETLLILYSIFTSSVLEDVRFPVNEEDLAYLKEHDPDDYQALEDDLKKGKWIPKTTINLNTDVDTYDIPNDFKSEITINKKDKSLHVVFGYLKYSDQLRIVDWMNNFFQEEDAKYEPIAAKYRHNTDVQTAFESGLIPSLEGLITIPENEALEYSNYQTYKMGVLAEIYKDAALLELDDQDLRKATLSEKYDIASKDARLDYKLVNILNKKQAEQKFGVKQEVRMLDPITGQRVSREFPLNIRTIIQALQLSEPSESSYDSDDESQYIVE